MIIAIFIFSILFSVSILLSLQSQKIKGLMFHKTPRAGTYQRQQSFFNSKAIPLKHWKNKRFQQLQQQKYKKNIFGEHYNYNYRPMVLNKQKKYLLEEQKNTEIERANRILFEKIKRIGERSKHIPRERMQTQEVRQNFRSNNNTRNLKTRKSTPFRGTQHLIQSKVSQLPSSRLYPTEAKILFKGFREIEGINFAITIFIESGMYIIFSEQGNMEHRIQMNLEDYKILLKQSLDNNHNNIFGMLRFNGTLLELAGTKRNQINIIEEEELMLPAVSQTPIKKYRSNTTN